jgi:hypothetical protein
MEGAQPSAAEVESVECPYERSGWRVEVGHAACPLAAMLGRFALWSMVLFGSWVRVA